MTSAFLQWCDANGIDTSKITITTDAATDDRTVHAACDIVPGDVVLAVPFERCVSTPGLKCGVTACPLDGDEGVDSSKQYFTPSERLAATLAKLRDDAERGQGEGEAYAPYVLGGLRDDIVDGPVFTWTNQEIAELQFPRAIGNCAKTKVRDGKVMKKLRETLPSESWVTKFPWALANARSRAIDLERGESFLAPGLDMFNHSHANANVKWESNAEGDAASVFLKATTRVSAGEELVVTYACEPAESFLLHMGFVGGMNPFDRVELWGSLAEAADWFAETFKSESGDVVLDKAAAREAAEELERQQRARERVAMVGLSSAGGATDDVSAELKLREMQNLMFGPSVGWKMDYDEALWMMFRHFTQALMPQEHADHIVMHAIKKRCEELLISMPTTIEEDEKIFSDENTPKRLKLAAEFRMYKKALLIRHLQSDAVKGGGGGASS